MATALVLLFAMTAGGVVWLARDVDRAISNRSAAHSVAFQAARSGAQQVDVAHLRTWDVVVVDEPAARVESVTVAARLLDAYGLTGEVTSVDVDGDRVTVVVSVTDGGRIVTGIGSARAIDGWSTR